MKTSPYSPKIKLWEATKIQHSQKLTFNKKVKVVKFNIYIMCLKLKKFTTVILGTKKKNSIKWTDTWNKYKYKTLV